MRRALITGIAGQDGSYLAEFLLKKGYEVYGFLRPTAESQARLEWVAPLAVELIYGSVEDYSSVLEAVRRADPHECYHLAAQSHVGRSFDAEFSTMHTNVSGTHHVLSAIKNLAPDCRFYFAGSSEMFGNADVEYQDETTPFNPASIYAISKVAGCNLTRHYRDRHGIHASVGILFNHESPRRGLGFVTRKITDGVARIKLGLADRISLGSMNAARDWGYAPEYVEAMWLMLQSDTPDDYVIATGHTYTVADFARAAFAAADLDATSHIDHDPRLTRPADVWHLCGDARKARGVLGWEPTVGFGELVRIMVDADLKRLSRSA